MKIVGFRISGFKSFADPVQVDIAPGMTGIVGPNGCGKSNVIESFRWSMGEASPKSMRADSMDDVIFNGTDIRAPKAACEVITIIDNSDRTAPPEFNDADILEVSRRLDRGEGSSYKVNGKPVKAKDVRVLYKDAGIGSSSSALVSQGKVAAIISAKPVERKQVLEEAAGVTGLASRRHEADLRLRATEQNLEQAEALEKGLSDQQSSLRRQARQARFRQEVDDLIRVAEATAFLVRWRVVVSRLASSRKEHEDIEIVIKNLMTEHIHKQVALEALVAKAAPTIKARNDAEMAHALALARIDSIRKEGEAARRQQAALERNIQRTISDLAKVRQEIGEASEEYLQMKDEKVIIEDDRQYDSVLIEEATADLVDAQLGLDEVVERMGEQSTLLAGLKVEWQAFERAYDDLNRRLQLVTQKLLITREKQQKAVVELDDLPQPDDEVNRLVEIVEDLAARHSDCQERCDGLNAVLSEQKGLFATSQTGLGIISSEIGLLQSSRKSTESIITSVQVAKGYDLAFAAAFTGELDASIGGDGERSWNSGHAVQQCPEGLARLCDYVVSPPELKVALGAVGVVEDDAAAVCALNKLKPGQMIVTLSGRRYRWDGFHSVVDDAHTREVMRERRLADLTQDKEAAEALLSKTRASLAAAEEAYAACVQEEKLLRSQLDQARRSLADVRSRQSELENRRVTLQASIQTMKETSQSLEADVAALESEVGVLDEQRAALPAVNMAEAKLASIRDTHRQLAEQCEVRRRALEKARRDADVRVERLASIQHKIAEFDRRVASAREHVEELEARNVEYRDELITVGEIIERLPEDEADANDRLEELAELLVAAAKAAKETEAQIEVGRAETRLADETLGLKREDRARVVAEIKAAQEATQELCRVIEEQLQTTPDRLAALAGVEEDAELPDLSTCDGRVEGLKRRRDAIGAVNPLAETLLKEVEDQLGKANAVRDELRTAVRRLREQITAFDRERRERLIEAFAAIDGHFRDLFTRVFGGGRAFLKLSGSDDPLEAGLEIYASPPGKNLQSMSLLSGGEQAMTALALVFAAFLIRPAPVCVLDEVDAALDDANIDRLTRLVEELAGEQTRFLVITHRSLTMSKCDRLYGVTMAEKGVSKLMALNMDEAVAYVQARQGEV